MKDPLAIWFCLTGSSVHRCNVPGMSQRSNFLQVYMNPMNSAGLCRVMFRVHRHHLLWDPPGGGVPALRWIINFGPRARGDLLISILRRRRPSRVRRWLLSSLWRMLEARILLSQGRKNSPLNHRTWGDCVMEYVAMKKKRKATWRTCVIRESATHLICYHFCSMKVAFTTFCYSNTTHHYRNPLLPAAKWILFFCKQFIKSCYHVPSTMHATAFVKNIHFGLQPLFLHQTSCQNTPKLQVFGNYSWCSFPWKRCSTVAWTVWKVS